MRKHPFRIAVEGGASREDLLRLLSTTVEIWPPMLTRPVSGAANVLDIISAAVRIAGPVEYLYEVADTRQTFLVWQGQVDGHILQACTILVDGDDGLVRQVRVLMRPWPVSKLFRDAMYEIFGSSIPRESWELDPKPVAPSSRHFTKIALQHVELSPDIVLHSPMLAKSVSGKQQVERAVGLAHQIQSASSYTSIIATPDLIIELFDCDADGHPMEGMWIQKINSEGQVSDLSVFMRPWPAVTVLHDRTKALDEKLGGIGPEYWILTKSPEL
jgi:hypothetical protein